VDNMTEAYNNMRMIRQACRVWVGKWGR